MMEKDGQTGEYFRAGVGAMILNRKGLILVLRRAGFSSAGWQLPQGGIRRGEDVLEGLRRELHEEIGIPPEQFVVIDHCPEWLTYELPEQYRSKKVGRGQAQRWFLGELAGESVRIEPDGIEFDAYEWVEKEELLERAVDFRLPIYRRLLEYFAKHLSRAKA
jgi:putative (di)nucleoside polyphosphate hydrolase